MVAPLNGTLSTSVLYRLVNPQMPSYPSDDGDYLSGIASKLVSRMNAIDTMRSKLQRLSSASQDLAGTKGAELFNTRAATSSDAKVVTASARTGASLKAYQLQVDQIAKAQQLQSDRQTNAASAVAADAYEFQVAVAGKTTAVKVDVANGDTNATVLKKTTDALNGSGAGIKAEVVTGDAAGTSRLQVTSGATGTNATLAVADTKGTLLSQLGLTANGTASAATGGTSVAAQDAKYRLNGGAVQTSQSNEISLDGSLATLSLKGAGNASVSVGVDNGKVANAVDAFVNDYNDALAYDKSVGNAMPARVAQSLSGIATANRSSLEQIGIVRAADGTLRLDRATLEGSLKTDPGKVSDVFNNGQTGVSREVRQSLGALKQGLNSEAAVTSRQLTQAFFKQQLSSSFNLLGPRYSPISQLLQAGGSAINEQA